MSDITEDTHAQRRQALQNKIADAVNGDFGALMHRPLITAIRMDFAGDWEDRDVRVVAASNTPQGPRWSFPHDFGGVAELHVLKPTKGLPDAMRLILPAGALQPARGDGFALRVDGSWALLEIGPRHVSPVIEHVDHVVVAEFGELASWTQVARETIRAKLGGMLTPMQSYIEDLLAAQWDAASLAERLLACEPWRLQRHDLAPPPPRRPNRLLCGRFGDDVRITVDLLPALGRPVATLLLPGSDYVKGFTRRRVDVLAQLARRDDRFDVDLERLASGARERATD